MLYNPFKKISETEYYVYNGKLTILKNEIIENFKQNGRSVRFSEKDKEWLGINAYFESSEKINVNFSIYLNEEETEFCVLVSLWKDVLKKRYTITLKLFNTTILDEIKLKELLNQAFDWADEQKFNETTWQEFDLEHGLY